MAGDGGFVGNGIVEIENKIYIYIYIYCGDQFPLKVLFRLDRLGLWPNDPVRERKHV